jgi:hypothetical protein
VICRQLGIVELTTLTARDITRATRCRRRSQQANRVAWLPARAEEAITHEE